MQRSKNKVVLLKTTRVAQVNERTCLNEATIIMESDDHTEELLLLSKPRRKLDLLPGKSISFYKQKFDCFLSSV